MKYNVQVTVEFDVCYEIEAESEEQAKEMAENKAMEDTFEDIPTSAEAWDVEAITEDVEMREIKEYFEKCKQFWISRGDREGVATSKAFWFDCVEIWNFEKSWTPVKEKFAMDFRGYKPGDEVPSEKVIEKGEC